MTAKGVIIGKVAEVEDGNTLHVSVERAEGSGHKGPGDRARIRIHSLRITKIASLTGSFTRSQLERMLKGKRVKCHLKSGDPERGILADVQLV